MRRVGGFFAGLREGIARGSERASPRIALLTPGRFNQSYPEQAHLARYAAWQAEAEAGYHFMPRRARMAVRTAGDMYNWTARRIEADPFVVFERKVKPKKARIVWQALWNGLRG